MLEASPLLHYNRRHGGQILTRVVRLHQERDAIPIVVPGVVELVGSPLLHMTKLRRSYSVG